MQLGTRLHDESKKRVPTDKYIKKYDILINSTGRGTAGRIAQINNVPCKTIVDGHMIIIRANDQVTQRYLGYALKAHQQKVLQLDEGSTGQTELDRERLLEEIIISYPESLDIQKKIVALLERIDEKIELNNKINDNLEQQAVLKVDQYFSATTKIVALSEIMDFVNGFAFQSSTYLPVGQYRIITIKNVQDGRIDSAGAAYIDCLPERMKKNCILEIGDALMSLTGNVGRVGIVCEDSLLLNQRVAKIVPHYKNFLPFLYFIFRKSSIKTQMESMAKGTAQLNLSPIEALNLSIPFERMTALAISKILKPIYQAIISNNQQNILLTALRDALLPKLMSGELDVSELDI